MILINKDKNLKVRPLALSWIAGQVHYQREQEQYLKVIILSVNAILLTDNDRNINIQTGFSIKSGKMSILLQLSF